MKTLKKKLSVIIIGLALAPQLMAQIPSVVLKLVDRDGTFFSSFNKKVNQELTGTPCRVILNPYSEDDSIAIESHAYDMPVAHLSDAILQSSTDKVKTYLLSDNGRRPGGSACGDITPMFSYKKTLEVSKNSLLIKQEYRCLFSSKSVLIQKCEVK